MMRDDQVDLLVDRFRGTLGRHGETGHHSFGRRVAFANEQADIVPLFGQIVRRKVGQIIGDVLNRRQCKIPEWRKIRNPKSETNQKSEMTKILNHAVWSIRI